MLSPFAQQYSTLLFNIVIVLHCHICGTIYFHHLHNCIQHCYSTMLSDFISIYTVVYIFIICTHVINIVIRLCYSTLLSYFIFISVVLYMSIICTTLLVNNVIVRHLHICCTIYFHHFHKYIQH